MGQPDRHILIVDDNESIHQDIESILAGYQSYGDVDLASMESVLFGEDPKIDVQTSYTLRIDHAYQGQEALEMVEKAEEEGRPYSLIYMDIRMPPGIDGIETIQRIKQCCNLPQIVICTAFSNYSRSQITKHFGDLKNLKFMSKPFDIADVKQTVSSFS